jgi:hypothetical protein
MQQERRYKMAEFPVDIVRFIQQAGDPGPTLLTGKMYTKDDGFGVTKLYYEDSAGVVVPLSDTELIILYERVGNPPSIVSAGQIFTKNVAGETQFFYESDLGTVTQLTPVVAVLPSILPLPAIGVVPPTLIAAVQMFCNLDGAAYQAKVVDDLGVVSQYSGDAYFTTVGTGGVAGPKWYTGVGSPEGVVTAIVGALYSNTTGGAGTTFYVKETGAGNTGWAAK